MLDFDVQRSTRRCAKTDRELKPGEMFYSVLLPKGGDVVRSDFCEEAWEGPPAEAVGWWKSQLPKPNSQKMHWAPNDVMLFYFEQLEQQPEKADVRYVLALLLVRRRIVRLEETETDESGREVMVLFCPRNENQYRVVTANPDKERIVTIQQELAQLLLADAA